MPARTRVSLTYAYVGQAEAPQGKADVIDVKGPDNFAARLFIDGETHLPIMLSWQARVAGAQVRRGRPAWSGGPPPGAHQRRRPLRRGCAAARPRRAHRPPMPEKRLYFADYRDFDGLQLPTRIRRAAEPRPRRKRRSIGSASTRASTQAVRTPEDIYRPSLDRGMRSWVRDLPDAGTS